MILSTLNVLSVMAREKFQMSDYLSHIINNAKTNKESTLEERTIKYKGDWDNWDNNKVIVSLDIDTVMSLRKNLWNMGLVEWEDYIFRYGKEIRFRDKSHAGIISLLVDQE